MTSTIAAVGVAVATAIGLVLGVIIARWLTPNLAMALGEAEKKIAGLIQEKVSLEQDRDRLRLDASDGKAAQLDRSALQAQVAELQVQLKGRGDDIDSLRKQLAESGTQLATANAEVAKLTERETQLVDKLEKQAEELEALQKKLQTEFENIANRILDTTSTKLTETSEQKLTDLLQPLKERIGEFQKKVEDTYDTERGERISLQTEIKNFVTANQALGQQADSLAKALRGDGQKRGRWGELVLERILESSSLTKGRDYVLQGNSLDLRGDDGSRQKPDAIVYLPEGKHIVIDSKVTLTSYERYVESESLEERETLHREFVGALKRHVEDLAGKRYQDNEKLIAHDFVLMFVPIEGALALAMQANDNFFQFAWDRRVAIVTPTSLLMTLRVVATIWRYQKQGENASQIAERAGALFDKLVGVVEELNSVGTALNAAKASFETAMGRLSTGRGNALSSAQKLLDMGVKAKKAMPRVRIGLEQVDVSAEDAEESSVPQSPLVPQSLPSTMVR